MHRYFLTLILLLAALPAQTFAAPPPQGSPSEVIALINSYRAENGLPAYVENGLLTQLAQGQADWIASQVQTNDIHAGPGGTRPRDRAYAAGYGDGQTIFISEIAKYGIGETPGSAVAWWKQSADHNPTMLASTYIEIGAGVSTDGNGRYYYVAVTGYIAGGTAPSTSSQPAAAQPAAPVMIPVTIAEPQADGSLVHIIRQGQTLWTVAAVYEVPLQQIIDLNGYSESQIIFPGDQVIVAPAGTVAPAQAEPSPTIEEPEPTEEPTIAPTAEATSQQLAALQSENNGGAPEVIVLTSEQAESQNNTMKWVVGLALASILGVIVASFFIGRPRVAESSDQDPFSPID
ncbi:MAG: CAP domain-containing protein [Anaerolineales bacterium]